MMREKSQLTFELVPHVPHVDIVPVLRAVHVDHLASLLVGANHLVEEVGW